MNPTDAAQTAPEKIVPGAVYRSLLQIAMLGSELSQFTDSKAIAEVLCDLRPDLPQAGIVLAMNEFCSGSADQGVAGLEAVVAEFPDSQLARAMLAVCLKISERSGWQQMLESVIEDGRDEYAIGLACAILGRTDPTDGQETPEGFRAADDALPAHAMWA